MLCIPITADTNEKALKDVQEASKLADVIEIRLDYIPHPNLEKLLSHRPRPTIATCRPTREGGRFEGPEEVRIKLLEQAVELGAEFVDIEHDSIQQLHKKGRAKVIISYHNFKETPANLKEIYARLSRSPADIVKIVTTANDITDNLKIFQLLEAVGARCNVPLHGNTKPLIAFCMGELGQISRILAPKYGGYITFGSLATGKESAPGQLTAREMLEVYHIKKINRETAIYGLIGNPVGHSLGPYIHNAAFRELGINAVYLPFKVENLREFVQGFKGLRVQGYSVTIPHKEAIVPLLDGLDPLAREIGAVNTVVNKAGSLMGYNTDSTAALRELEEAMGDLNGKKATLIGAGGAARAIAFGLKKRGADITLVNRTEDRARRLAQELGCHYRRFEDVTKIDGEVLINTTSVGMYPKTDISPVPPQALRPGMWVFDIVYNPLQTRLLREAEERGCHTLDGLRMFLYQAAQQFELWTGRPAPLELMERVIRERLGVRGQGSGVNIYLIGFRGTGKTTVGKLLAKELGWEFIDADDYLEKKVGKTIKQIFQEGGEGLFRDEEGEVIRELSEMGDKIVAAGGGAVLREENVRNMRQNGLVILLEADAPTIHDRLQRDPRSHTQRPNLTNLDSLNEIIHLLEYRRPYYEKAADHRINTTTTTSPVEVAKRILSIYKSWSKTRE